MGPPALRVSRASRASAPLHHEVDDADHDHDDGDDGQGTSHWILLRDELAEASFERRPAGGARPTALKQSTALWLVKRRDGRWGSEGRASSTAAGARCRQGRLYNPNACEM